MVKDINSYNLYRKLKLNLLRVVLIIYSVIVLIPFLWIIINSFKSNQEFYSGIWSLPRVLLWENYTKAWEIASLGDYFINSIIVVVLSLILNIFLASMASYTIARFDFICRDLIYKIFLGGLLVPTLLPIIPLFFLFRDLKLYDTRIGLVLVNAIYRLPFALFVLIPFSKTLPRELEDSAKIDGCSYFMAYRKIMLPLTKPGLITVGVFNFIYIWNEYLFVLTLIADDTKRTLPLGIVKLATTAQVKTEWGALFAGIITVLLPTIIVYGFFQTRLVGGLTTGSLKG